MALRCRRLSMTVYGYLVRGQRSEEEVVLLPVTSAAAETAPSAAAASSSALHRVCTLRSSLSRWHSAICSRRTLRSGGVAGVIGGVLLDAASGETVG